MDGIATRKEKERRGAEKEWRAFPSDSFILSTTCLVSIFQCEIILQPMTIIGVEFDRRKRDIVHLLSFLSNLHGVSKFSPLSTSLHCHVYRGPHDLSIAEMKKYNFLIRKKKKKKDRMANGTLPLSRLMRLQMAHMRRAQCCLSDFCSVSKVTMIDGYF